MDSINSIECYVLGVFDAALHDTGSAFACGGLHRSSQRSTTKRRTRSLDQSVKVDVAHVPWL